MSNVTKLPVIPMQRRNAAVIPLRDASDGERNENIMIVSRDLRHAIRKATVVAEFHGELPWLARLLQAALTEVKDKIGEGS